MNVCDVADQGDVVVFHFGEPADICNNLYCTTLSSAAQYTPTNQVNWSNLGQILELQGLLVKKVKCTS